LAALAQVYHRSKIEFADHWKSGLPEAVLINSITSLKNFVLILNDLAIFITEKIC